MSQNSNSDSSNHQQSNNNNNNRVSQNQGINQATANRPYIPTIDHIVQETCVPPQSRPNIPNTGAIRKDGI